MNSPPTTDKRDEHGMTRARYNQLSRSADLNLTQEEIDAGWFFHNGFDGLLVHKSWPEAELD